MRFCCKISQHRSLKPRILKHFSVAVPKKVYMISSHEMHAPALISGRDTHADSIFFHHKQCEKLPKMSSRENCAAKYVWQHETQMSSPYVFPKGELICVIKYRLLSLDIIICQMQKNASPQRRMRRCTNVKGCIISAFLLFCGGQAALHPHLQQSAH